MVEEAGKRYTIWQEQHHGSRIVRQVVGGEEATTLEVFSPASGGPGKAPRTASRPIEQNEYHQHVHYTCTGVNGKMATQF